MNYKEELTNLYLEEKESSGCPPDNKFEFIGSTIFDFTTDDGALDELLAKKMIEVVTVIINKTNYDYIKEEANYINYITMVNMPFLQGKLEYGTSIRGAWFDEYGIGNDETYAIGTVENFVIPKSEIINFIKQLLEWSVQP